MDKDTAVIKKIDIFAEKSEKIISYAILIIFTVIFGFLSIESVWHTSIFDPTQFESEVILYKYDNILINLLTIALITFMLYRTKKYWEKFNLKILTVIAYTFLIIIGLVWIFSVKSDPTNDSYIISNSGKAFMNGDYEALMNIEGYFNKYPFQLGFAFLCELYYTITGSVNTLILQVVNLLSVCFIMGALLKISRYVFNNDRLQILITILMMSCIQPIMFSTFVYGNLIGYALSIWAVVFEMRYINGGKKYNMLIAALLISFGIVIKLNSMIVLIVMMTLMFIHILKKRKLFDIISIVACVILANTLTSVIIMQYENRAGIKLSGGIPMVCWLNMGLNESAAAPGWYDHNTGPAHFERNDHDSEIAADIAIDSIKERLVFFIKNPSYINEFFNKKIVSQWNEPTYQSIWSSQVRGHLEPVPNFVQSIYTGYANTHVINYMNRYQEIIFSFTFISALYMLKNKKLTMLHVILMLVLLGGFFYHLLFEAKSQYILIYFVTCVPIAGHGLFSFIESLEKKHEKMPSSELSIQNCELAEQYPELFEQESEDSEKEHSKL